MPQENEDQESIVIQPKALQQFLVTKELTYSKLSELADLPQATILAAVREGNVARGALAKIAEVLGVVMQDLINPPQPSTKENKALETELPSGQPGSDSTSPTDMTAVIFTHFSEFTYSNACYQGTNII